MLTMKQTALLLLTTVLSIHSSPQEKQTGIDLGVNKLNPTDTGSAYEADIAEIKERLDQIWQLQRHILLSLR